MNSPALTRTRRAGVPMAVANSGGGPASVVDQMAAIIDVLDGEGLRLKAILARLKGAPESLLKQHLGTLVLSGEIKNVRRGWFGRP
ncbi:MAG: hypothetical protein SGI90_11965 [Candidatus Eisenbacteria bacterium]|nr:hypothetical protein [Candidatus Eisenbacteria bacterium]